MSIFRLSTEKNNRTRVLRHDKSPKDILDELRITPELFKEICPALIVQIDGHDCEVDEEILPSNYTIFHGEDLILFKFKNRE